MRKVWRALRGVFMVLMLVLCAALFYLVVIMGGVRPEDESAALSGFSQSARYERRAERS